jgi:GLPGLI family protein
MEGLEHGVAEYSNTEQLERMKYKILVLGFAFFLIINQLWAQKKISEGTISYDIVINTGTEKPQSADFLNGATSTVYIKGNKSRTDMVSSLGMQSTIIDNTKGTIVILKEYGEQKYMINLTPQDWKDINKKYEDVKFAYDPSASKNILGYACKKAIGRLDDGTSFTVWYTPELVPENRDFQYVNRTLPGLALEYETTLGNLKVTYTVAKISFSPVPVAKFDLPRSGFRVMTYQESKGLH